MTCDFMHLNSTSGMHLRFITARRYASAVYNIHRFRTKGATIFLRLTLTNADRFLKFFHRQT